MGWEHGSNLGMAGVIRRRPSIDGTRPAVSLPMAEPPMESAPMGSSHDPAAGPQAAGGWEQVSLLDLVPAAPTPVPAPASPSRPAAAEPTPAEGTTAGPPPPSSAVAEPTSTVKPRLSLPPLASGATDTLAAERRAGVAAGCPTQLLILDTETTGLDPEQDHCIEVGAILFHVPTRAVLTQLSFLLPCESNPAAPINGIPAAVTRLSQPWDNALAYFRALVEAADVIVAHNASFDRQWFGRGVLPALAKPWLCSMEDLRWPAERQLRATPSVRDLALAYGVPVWAAHRALTDCIYLAQVFSRCDDLEELLLAGLEPRRLYRAQLPYEQRHRARQAGFRWNDPIPKAWTRRLSEREAAGLGFPVAPVEPVAGSGGSTPIAHPVSSSAA